MGQLIGGTSGGGGGGIPNANVYWANVGPVNPAPFLIRVGSGITGAMWTFHSSGVYTLDMSSILTTGIYAAFVGINGNQQIPTCSFSNGALNNEFVPPAMTIGLAFAHWNGAGFLVFDPDFSIMILAK